MSDDENSEELPVIKAGVIGYPIAHSRSPKIHGYWLKLKNINGTYDAHEVEPENLEPFIKALPENGFAGINVTLPHKEHVLPLMDEVEPFAKRVGAVNTIVVTDEGKLIGRNTDGYGFMENLRAGAPDWKADFGPAAVIGSGGAARAIIAALQDAGVPEIRLTNRSLDKALALAEELQGDGLPPITVRPFEDRASLCTDAGLLVNTTSLGMVGKDPLEIDMGSLPDVAVVTDIVYTPLKTPLLQAAETRGHKIVDGLGMLLHQARPGFEAWFGQAVSVTPMLRAMIEHDITNPS